MKAGLKTGGWRLKNGGNPAPSVTLVSTRLTFGPVSQIPTPTTRQPDNQTEYDWPGDTHHSTTAAVT